jgi:hypothetical protein
MFRLAFYFGGKDKEPFSLYVEDTKTHEEFRFTVINDTPVITKNEEPYIKTKDNSKVREKKEAKLKAIELFGINIMTAINIVEAEQKLVIQE